MSRLQIHSNGNAPHIGYGYAEKIIGDYGELAEYVRALRVLGKKIVFTMGSWDTLHVGHVRYLNTVASYADILVVGVDSDATVKLYKGDDRPVIEEAKRVEMVTYLQCVDYVTLIHHTDLVEIPGAGFNWNPNRLLPKIQPDFFVAVEGSYPDGQQKSIQKWCDNFLLIPRQASDISTTDIIKRLQQEGGR